VRSCQERIQKKRGWLTRKKKDRGEAFPKRQGKKEFRTIVDLSIYTVRRTNDHDGVVAEEGRKAVLSAAKKNFRS